MESMYFYRWRYRYPQTYRFFKINTSYSVKCNKNLIERTIPFIKGITESFDEYFSCNRRKQESFFFIQSNDQSIYKHIQQGGDKGLLTAPKLY